MRIYFAFVLRLQCWSCNSASTIHIHSDDKAKIQWGNKRKKKKPTRRCSLLVFAIERCVQVTNKYKNSTEKSAAHQIEMYIHFVQGFFFVYSFCSVHVCHYTFLLWFTLNFIIDIHFHFIVYLWKSFMSFSFLFFSLDVVFFLLSSQWKSACDEIIRCCTLRVMLTDTSIYCLSITQTQSFGLIENVCSIFLFCCIFYDGVLIFISTLKRLPFFPDSKVISCKAIRDLVLFYHFHNWKHTHTQTQTQKSVYFLYCTV